MINGVIYYLEKMEYGLADMNKNLSQVLQDIAQKQMELSM